MSADAIQQVSLAIQSRLRTALAAQGIPGDVYVGPLDDQDALGNSVVLFLYRLAVNASLRNTEHWVVAAANPADPPLVYRDSLPLDLHYLVTAGSTLTGGELDSLRVLGHAIRALNEDPNLVGVSTGGEPIRLSFDPVTSEEMSRIWTLFPTANYRTSVTYIASPVWIDPARPPAVVAAVRRETYDAGPRAA